MEQLNKYCKSTKRLCKNLFISTKTKIAITAVCWNIILGLVYMEVGDPRCVREPAKVG